LKEITAAAAAAGAAGVTKMPVVFFFFFFHWLLTQPICWASYLPASRHTLSRYLWLESRLKAFHLFFLLPSQTHQKV
jgi:hypothetical protein